jgi:membrane associated rhomboid family serine protease
VSKVARSLVVFGWYLVIFGASLVLAPNLVLSFFGLPPTDEVWIRIVGVLVLIIAYFNVRMGPVDFRPYAWLTVHARTAVFGFMVGFVLAGLVKPVVILVGAIDLAGALWTAAALRGAARSATSSQPVP